MPRPLRNLENISGGELARWIKLTTPRDRRHVIRVLETAASLLRSEIAVRLPTVDEEEEDSPQP
jgi:hypothetical protein